MSETDTSRLSQDEVYHLLSNPRRRFIISYLRDERVVDLQELASKVAAWENETSVDELTDQQQKRVYVSLYQTHIPKLEDAGIVTYDSDAGRVQLRERVEQLDRYLPQGDDEPRNWRRIYLAVVVGGALFYALVTLNVPGFAAISETLAGVLILLALAAVVSMQYVEERRTSVSQYSESRRTGRE
jgi:DNA-binding transcriptional ArsR family regulator